MGDGVRAPCWEARIWFLRAKIWFMEAKAATAGITSLPGRDLLAQDVPPHSLVGFRESAMAAFLFRVTFGFLVKCIHCVTCTEGLQCAKPCTRWWEDDAEQTQTQSLPVLGTLSDQLDESWEE